MTAAELLTKTKALIEAAHDLREALLAAQEELRLIHMKDTKVVYNPMLRTQITLALQKAEGDR